MKLLLQYDEGDKFAASGFQTRIQLNEVCSNNITIPHGYAYGATKEKALENLKERIHARMEQKVRDEMAFLKFLVEQK